MAIINIIESEETTAFGGIGNTNIVFIPVQDAAAAGSSGKKMYQLSTVGALTGNANLNPNLPQYTLARALLGYGYEVLYYAVQTLDNTVYNIIRDKLNYSVTYIVCSDYPEQALEVAAERGDCVVLIDDWITQNEGGDTYIIGTDGRYKVTISGNKGTSEANSAGVQYQINYNSGEVQSVDKLVVTNASIGADGTFNVQGVSEAVNLSDVVWGANGTFTISDDPNNRTYTIEGENVVYTQQTALSYTSSSNSFTDTIGEVQYTYSIVTISTGLQGIEDAAEYYETCKDKFSGETNASYGIITCPCENDVPGSQAYLYARSKRITINPVYLPVMGVSNGGVGTLAPRFEMGSDQWDLWQNIQDTAAVGSDNDGFRINPIVNIPSYGYCIMGNATLVSSPEDTRSYLSFANIRMLLVQIQKVLYSASLYKIGDSNDLVAWNAYKNLITPYLDQMVQGRGMQAYKFERMTTDVNGNTPPKGTVWARLTIIKPIESIEKFTIYVNVTDGTTTSAEE